MHEIPLEIMDAEVRRAVLATEKWRASLTAMGGDPSTLPSPLARHRAVAGQAGFDALGARILLSHETALREALRRWVGALTVARVTEADRVDEAKVAREEKLTVRLELRRTTSFRGAWAGLLCASNAEEAAAWLDALCDGAPAVAAVRRERAAREEEIVRRLGFASFAELTGGPAPATLRASALAFLDETRDLARELQRASERRGEPSSMVSQILGARAREAGDGWPGHLTLRNLVETLRAPSDLGRGLRIEVPMPAALGAASFARALERFGVAYRRAVAVSARATFATTVPPWFTDAHRFGFAFASLATLPTYHQRGLGVSARVAGEQSRTLAKAALTYARSIAMTCLLAERRARPDAGELAERSADVYGHPAPAALLGAFPHDEDAEIRLEALLTTLPFLTELRDLFDEDWFRNPRAWQFLRLRAGASVDPSGPAPAPEARSLARAFEKALG